ncbi:MAG: Nif11-like leader peptide family natural product precursor [Planctomycetota bacterium]|nr:Nif11-like leader peptide family natural product precursor [Planctomycetota bacterium]
MSKQHVKRFREQVAAEPALAEQVREVMSAGGDPPALIALARARGFEFSQAEAEEVLAESELTELELDLVAGGNGGSGAGCGGNSGYPS